MTAMRKANLRLLLFAALITPLLVCDSRAETAPDIVLRTTVTGKQNQRYIELPFEVPSGVTRITVVFRYSGKDERTAIDLGVADPQRLRGWSGGNKDGFTISDSDATPSYLPGAIVAGRWRLLVGVPNIRPQSVSAVEAKIYFARESRRPSGFVDQALESKARWYRGDLHLHTGHSDGRCTSQSGKEIPCPTFVTLQAAVHR